MYLEIVSKLENIETEFEEIKAQNESTTEQIGELTVKEKDGKNKQILNQLKALVMLNEKLKAQERAFKQGCKKRLLELQALRDSVEIDIDSEDSRRIAKVEALYSSDKQKYDKVRRMLAQRNQQIAMIRRKMNSYPSRAELLQYEKRFVELYEQTSTRLKETKKYYDLYNTLSQVFDKMQNEVSLLNSVQTAFNNGLTNPTSRTEFITNFDKALEGISQQKDYSLKMHLNAKQQLEAKREMYNKLANRQRKYFKAVKEFQQEIERNEYLVETLGEE